MFGLLRSLAAGSAALLCSALAYGATSYTTQVAPLPLVDINNRGVILAASGPLAFLWNGKPDGAGGQYTLLSTPGNDPNVVYAGLSDLNEVVGGFTDFGSGRSLGFVSSVNGLELIEVPGSASTAVRAISPNGRYLGVRAYSDLGTASSYLLDRTTGLFTDISPAGSYGSAIEGVTDSGKVVGRMNTDAGSLSFVFQNGQVETFSIDGSPYTFLYGASDAGYLVGSSGSTPPGPGGPEWNTGFISHGAETWKVEQGTRILGVNSSGVAVGVYSLYSTHGVLLTPVPEPASVALMLGGLVAVFAWRARRVAPHGG